MFRQFRLCALSTALGALTLGGAMAHGQALAQTVSEPAATPRPEQQPAPAAAGPTKLTIMVFQGAQNLPLFAAEHTGAFARNNLAVDRKIAPNSQELRDGLAAGRYQIVHTSVDNAVAMAEQAKVPRSHDNVYSTILGFMRVETSEYKKSLDLFGACDRSGRPVAVSTKGGIIK